MSRYQPPLTLTSDMQALVVEISEQVGRLLEQSESIQAPQLRRGNRIRTIQASLASPRSPVQKYRLSARGMHWVNQQ